MTREVNTPEDAYGSTWIQSTLNGVPPIARSLAPTRIGPGSASVSAWTSAPSTENATLEALQSMR